MLIDANPKTMPAVRTAAFVKRMAIAACHAPPHFGLGLLSSIRTILKKHPKVHQLLDTEATVTTGK